MKTITVQQLKERLAQGESLTLIDVREPEEVAQGMIPGAVHIPLGEIPDRFAEIPKDRETIMICRSGNRSSRAIEFLQHHGYDNLVNMTGGMLAWEQI
ncbi:rhodanese-like domain-containing protein [Paenibacillus hamazuiensis]|uniref:rhodanese-like domain-containing protein n=1 Tax=Paenibacillus hamazuiensis TaxID=2936508 RepID=UPI00200C5407|nr:rhodanese-like domain-containing protein [Paenibacillus hamazuiensis]